MILQVAPPLLETCNYMWTCKSELLHIAKPGTTRFVHVCCLSCFAAVKHQASDSSISQRHLRDACSDQEARSGTWSSRMMSNKDCYWRLITSNSHSSLPINSFQVPQYRTRFQALLPTDASDCVAGQFEHVPPDRLDASMLLYSMHALAMDDAET